MKKLLRSLSLLTIVCLFMTQSSVAQSSDATLASISLTVGTLSPGFVSTTENYTATVANTFTSTTITASKNEGTATMLINGVPATGATTIPLAPGANNIIIIVTAGNGTTTKQYKVVVTRAPSAIATLTSLSGDSGTLSPAYSPSVSAYALTVNYSVSNYTITANRAESTATMKVKGVTVTGNSTSVPLVVGLNAIDIVMIAGDGTTTLTYTINVTRTAPSTVATLSSFSLVGGTLSPAFTTANGSYTSNVTGSSITITAIKLEANATIKLNGVPVSSVTATPIGLVVGLNTISLLITAQDGITTKTYTFNIIRAAPSTVATLSALTTSAGSVSPAFTSANNNYTITVLATVSSTSITATKTEVNSTIKVNGVTTTSGSASASIALATGSNVITVLVTAQDGTTTKTYTITVTRPVLSSDNTLSKLLATNPISPAFNPSVTSYSVSIPSTSDNLTLNATATDPNATIKVLGIVRSGSFNIPMALGSTVPFVFEVTATDGSKKEYTLVASKPVVISKVATLSGITLISGVISDFSPEGSTSYSVKASRLLTEMSISATVTNPGSILKINDVVTASGTLTKSVPFGDTPLVYTINVLSTDTTTTKTYTLTVSKDGPSADLRSASGGFVLTPAFDRAVTSYTGIVSNTTVETNMLFFPFEATATMKLNGTTTTGSGVTFPTPVVGVNPAVVEVTNATGLTKKYTFNITRVEPEVANLRIFRLLGLLSPSPSFQSWVYDYSTSVINDSTSVTLSISPFTTGATMKVNGASVATGASPRVNLAVGTNIVTAVVTSPDGLVSKTYTLKIIRAGLGGTIPPSTGVVLLSPTANEVVVGSATQALTVTIPAGTVNPGVNYSSLISGGTGIIPQTSMLSDVSSVSIPGGTRVTSSDPNWNGVIGAPVVTSYDLPPVYGETITTGLIIEVGSATGSLSFDKAVRLILPGQAGKRAAYVHSGVYKEITTVGTTDNQQAGDALPTDGAFKINVGADLVIWTKAFSQFITFTQAVDLNVAVVAADMDGLTADMIKGANADLDHITTVLTNPLPATLTGGSTVTWSSSNPAVISADGKTVNRQVFGAAVPVITLTANVKKGAISEHKTFTLTTVELANQAPTLNAISNQVLCFTTGTQSIALSGITAGPESGQTTTLSVSSSNTTLLKQLAVNNSTGIISYVPDNTAGGTTTITVTIKDNGGTANGGADTFSRTFTITVNSLPVVAINSSIGISISKGLTTVLTASGGVSYTWANAAGIIGAQNTATLTVRPATTTTYTVTAVNSSGCTTVQSITITVLEDYKSLDVANIITPNGDGKNDALIIKNLDMYSNNTLKIFDRAGRQVYVKQNYTNDWTGTLDGAQLAQDTYYYVLYFNNGIGQIKGFVSIVK